MKIFISWSGQRSKEVAELLDQWLRCVIQAAKPWISSRDIDRGALWFTEISEQLSDTGIGIVCLTQENKDKPWILFETGALAKGLSHHRVCTLLVDLAPSDIEDPLAQFNHTFPTEDSIWSLVQTLNKAMKENSLEEKILATVFKTYWPQFKDAFDKILEKKLPADNKKKRSEVSILTEILDNTRSLGNRVRQLESKIESNREEIFSTTQNKNSTLAEFLRMNEPKTRAGITASLAARGLSIDEILKSGYDPNDP